MNNFNNSIYNHAAFAIGSGFGILSGLGGMTHGIGEVLQGNVSPDGLFIASWAEGPIAEHLGGDPGMTIIPNFLITGIVCLIISLMMIVWSARFIRKRKGGVVLIMLSILLLLFGGGGGPPALGLLAGLGALGIHSKYPWLRQKLPNTFIITCSRIWPWLFGLTLLNAIFLVVGHVVAVLWLGVTNAEIFVFSFFLAVLSISLCILCGIGYDIHKTQEVHEGKMLEHQ